MAGLTAFGATQLVLDVKELLEVYLQNEDWGMQYSNTDYGIKFNRTSAWSNRVTVTGGDQEGALVVTHHMWDKDETYHLRGEGAVEEAAQLVLSKTRT